MDAYSFFNLRKDQLNRFWGWIRIMKNFALIPLISISLVVMEGCDGDDDPLSNTGTKLSVSDIQGSWIANSASFSAPEYIDLIEEGATVTLVIQSNGRFTFTIIRPDEPNEVYTGKLGFDGEYLAVRFDDDDEDASFFISLVNQILTLRGQTELDLDDNGVFDFGILELIMVRN
jgi:hypothetical protein